MSQKIEDSMNVDERTKFMTQLEIPLIIFILKKCSSRQNPLYASKIAQYIGILTGEVHAAKTIQRKLKKLCLLQRDTEDEIVNNTLLLTFGGCVMETTNENIPNIKKVQTRYYFQPLLDSSDVALICGAITSNRYLTPQEKKYLLTREQTLAVCDDTAENVEDIEAYTYAPQSLPPKSAALPNQASTLLHLVNQLHDAIEKNYQIQIIYGIYDLDPDNFRKIQFHARNSTRPYTLNPYALLWSNGAYYLLATHAGHDNPVHFRVDRILSAHPQMKKEDATQKSPCAKLPDSLKPFFTMDISGSKAEIDVAKYIAAYPLMGIYDVADMLNCYIECTASTLSILVDHFGTDLMIQPSPLPHGKDALDFHGRPQQFFAVQIKQVQYDNVLQLCLQQHSTITALHPRRLVEDVKKGLTASLQKYQHVIDSLDPVQPLRCLDHQK